MPEMDGSQRVGSLARRKSAVGGGEGKLLILWTFYQRLAFHDFLLIGWMRRKELCCLAVLSVRWGTGKIYGKKGEVK